MRILFFGDGSWATAALRFLQQDHQLLGVVLRRQPTESSFPAYVSQLDLPVYQPAKVNATSFLNEISARPADICLSASYDQIIRHRLLTWPRLGFINFHAAPLPHYRGRAALIWQVLNGVSHIGLTTHWMNERVDRGAVICRRQLRLGEDETYSELLERINDYIPELLSETLAGLEQPAVESTTVADHGTYFPRRQAGDEFIDWRDTSRRIHDQIRALSLPGLYAATYDDKGREIRIIRSRRLPEFPQLVGIPGSVIGRDAGGVIVKTGDTALHLSGVLTNGEESVPDWPLSTRLLGSEEMRLRCLESRVEKLVQQLRSVRHYETEEITG